MLNDIASDWLVVVLFPGSLKNGRSKDDKGSWKNGCQPVDLRFALEDVSCHRSFTYIFESRGMNASWYEFSVGIVLERSEI
jgi:hypothetical protein